MLKVIGGNLEGQYSDPDSTYTNANVPGKPILYYYGGDKVYDESGKGNHGTDYSAKPNHSGALSSYGSYYFNAQEKEMITMNFGLESWDTPHRPNYWVESYSGDSILDDETTEVYAGNHSAKFTVDNAGNSVTMKYWPSPLMSFTAGKTYKASFWGKGSTTKRVNISGNTTSGGGLYKTFTLTTDWDKSTEEFISDGTENTIFITRGYSSEPDWHFYIDDVSMKEIQGYIETANSDSLELSNDHPFSLAYFIKPDSIGVTQAIVVKDSIETSYGHLIKNGGLLIYTDDDASAELESSGFFTDLAGRWTHVCQTYDGDKIRLYKNGAAVDSSSTGITLKTNSNSLFLGKCRGHNYPLYGCLDDVKFYSRELTPEEADSLCQGESISDTLLKLHYTFDLPDSMMIFVLDPNNNPSYTEFALQDSLSGWYIDATAEPESLRAGPPGEWGWRTYDQWGAALGDTLTGIMSDSLYVIRAKARSGE